MNDTTTPEEDGINYLHIAICLVGACAFGSWQDSYNAGLFVACALFLL